MLARNWKTARSSCRRTISQFDRLNHSRQLVQYWALFRHGTQTHFNHLIQGRKNKPLNLPRTRSIRLNKALDIMAGIVHIRFRRSTGIIQPTSWGYLRRQAVSPMALNVTDDQAVAIFREEKIINANITMKKAKGIEIFDSVNMEVGLLSEIGCNQFQGRTFGV